MSDLIKSIESIGNAFDQFKQSHDERYDALQSRLEAVEAAKDRPRIVTATQEPRDAWFDRKSGQPVTVLAHADRMTTENRTGVSLGRWLRGVLLGDKNDDRRELADEMKALATSPDASGGYTVPAPLASEFIDRLRAAMVLSRIGARTVPMTSKSLQIARVATDPTTSWHIQNAAITATDPTLSAVSLNAHTVVCVTKLSLELAQDSANIEELLTQTLARAVAGEIDAAGLAGTGAATSPASNSPTGVANFSSRNTVTSIGAPTNWDFVINGMRELLVDNVPLDRIGAVVMHPLLWSTMAKKKTGISSDNSPLPLPPPLVGRPMEVTTAAPLTGSPTTTTAFIGDWQDLLWGVRQDVTVRILNEAYFASNLQLAVVAYARCDFQPARAASFCTLEGIQVGGG